MKRNLTLLICLIIISLLVLGFTVRVKVLRIYDGDNKSADFPIIYQALVGNEREIVLKWKHSVTKQYVIEKFRIDGDNCFEVVEMIFNEHGPNLPNGPEFGTKWEIKDGYFRVYNYSLVFEELPVRIGQVVAEHFLIFKGAELSLKEVDEPGGYIILRVQDVTLYDFMKEGERIWLRKLALRI